MQYFNPRPPRGGRQDSKLACTELTVFQSTPSARRATYFAALPDRITTDFNPRPPRGGRRVCACNVVQIQLDKISIHALREEGDCFAPQDIDHAQNFNPRPPRGGRPPADAKAVGDALFQSTPSARRATWEACPLCDTLLISIHALREEGDGQLENHQMVVVPISIHALREEGDRSSAASEPPRRNFNPRPPRGGRRQPPAGFEPAPTISIHALREEGDLERGVMKPETFYFNPRPPRGGRRIHYFHHLLSVTISIHALREEGDVRWGDHSFRVLPISIHALREEGDS